MHLNLARPLALTLAALLALPAAAQIYSWKDKDGRVHYGDVPPPSGEVKTLRQGQRGAVARQAEPEESPSGEAEATEEGAEGKAPDQEGKQPAANGKKPAAAQPAAAQPVPPSQPKTLAERELEFRQRRAQAAEAEAKARKEEEAAAEQADRCQRARGQLAGLNSGSRLVRYDAAGNRIVMSDAERDAEAGRINQYIEANCK